MHSTYYGVIEQMVERGIVKVHSPGNIDSVIEEISKIHYLKYGIYKEAIKKGIACKYPTRKESLRRIRKITGR